MAVRPHFRLSFHWTLIPVGLSAAFFYLRAGPLHGTVIALPFAGALLVGLTGYLVARALGLLSHRNLLVQLASLVTSGVVIALLLGGGFRFMGWPVSSYILGLHVLMLVLSLLPAHPATLRPQAPPLGSTVTLLVCTVALVALAATTARFAYAGELSDRGYFASVNHWLLTDGGSEGRMVRIIGQSFETRLRFEGLLMLSAALESGSGISAFDYQWHWQPPLLISVLPVVLFALVYRLTRNQRTAALAVALLTLLTAQTFQYTFYEHMAGFTGRHPVLDLRTLREVALTILLPMSLYAFITALRRRALQWMLLTVAGLLVLLATHFTAALGFILVAGMVGVTQERWRWRSLHGRRALLVGGGGALLLAAVVALPLLTVRSRIPGLLAPVSAAAVCAAPQAQALVQFIDVPGLGSTYILAPTAILGYHPAAVVALALSMLLIVRWRRRLAVRYLLAPFWLVVLVGLSPPVFFLLTRLTGLDFLIGNPCYVNDLFVNNLISNLSATLVFAISLPVVLAVASGELFGRWRTIRRTAVWLIPVTTTLLLGISLIEPIPIPFSLRDQITMMHDALAHLDTPPAVLTLATTLQRQLDPTRTWRVLAPDEAGAAIIQLVPNTLLAPETVGDFQAATARFFGRTAPLLDAADLELLQLTEIDLVVLRVWDTRLPQFLFDPERFEFLLAQSGFLVFKVRARIVRSDQDAWYSALNEFYGQHFTSTWQATGWSSFEGQPVTDDPQAETLAQVGAALPESPLRDYGLAWLAALTGQSTADDVARWQHLIALQPLLTGVYAWTLPPEQGVELLVDALARDSTEVQLLAARELLSERYLYLLSPDDMRTLVSRIDGASGTWNMLTRNDFSGLTLKRIELLLARGEWRLAVDWLDQLPALEIRADEYAMQALALLAQGETTAALDHLARTLEADWLEPRQRLHPDRWENNTALQLYWILRGNLAERDGQVEAARTAYQQASAAGDEWAARVFRARLEEDAVALAALDTVWRAQYGEPRPEFVSLLHLAESGQLAVNDTQISRDGAENSIQVSTLFGSAYAQFLPQQSVRYDLRTVAGGQLLAQVDRPAITVHGALLRREVNLQIDPALPELTQAQLIVQSRYDNRVQWGETITPLVLARPAAAEVPTAAQPIDAVALEPLTLTHSIVQVDAQTLNLTLYWEANELLTVDYQISVRIVDEAGQTFAQQDNGPVNGQYPMAQWRTGVTIADPHQLVLPADLPTGRYTVIVVVYPLDTLTPLTFRLPNGTETQLVEVGNFSH